MRGSGVEVGASGVLNAGVEGHGGGLGAAGGLDALGGRNLVYVVEVELQISGELAELFRLGQAGEGVIAGDAGEGDGSFDQTGDGFGEKSEEEVLATFWPRKTTETDGAGAGLLEGLDLAEADASGELVTFIDDGLGVGGSSFESSGRGRPGRVDAGRFWFQWSSLFEGPPP